MGMNEYCLQAMVNERVEQLRADMQVAALRRARRAARRPVRMVIGQLLVRIGSRLLGGLAPAPAAHSLTNIVCRPLLHQTRPAPRSPAGHAHAHGYSHPLN